MNMRSHDMWYKNIGDTHHQCIRTYIRAYVYIHMCIRTYTYGEYAYVRTYYGIRNSL